MGDPAQTSEWMGTVTAGTGAASVVRIPVPGSNGLFIELSPRGFVPKTGSTTSFFIQAKKGRPTLRLDFGFNKTTGTVNYHWNQQGTFDLFKIANHTPTGKLGELGFKAAKVFKFVGKRIIVVGVVLDAVSIVVAEKRVRQVVSVLSGWGGMWAGCKIVGAGGAALGSFIEPGGGTGVGGLGGCVIGGIGGGLGASWAAEKAYDYVEETFFHPLPEEPAPDTAP